MNARIQSESQRDSRATLLQVLARLAREASIEIAARDVGHVSEGRGLLAAGKKIYVNHLPGQTWTQTEAACAAIGEAGYAPVPHLPVRLLTDAATLERTVDGLVSRAHVREVLLIAGDYPQPIGPYGAVSDVMRSGSKITRNHAHDDGIERRRLLSRLLRKIRAEPVDGVWRPSNGYGG